MTETDLLDNLSTSNPNMPATQGVVLLLRAEMKSEFKTLRTETTQQFAGVYSRLGGLEQRMDRLEQRMDRLEQRMDKLENSLEAVAQQVAWIVKKLS